MVNLLSSNSKELKTKPISELKLLKKPLTIICDLDGILNNFKEICLSLMNEYRIKVNLDVNEFECTHYNLHDIHEEAGQYIYSLMNDPKFNFGELLKPLPGAITYLEAIRDLGHKIIVCSSPGRVVRNKNLFAEKKLWLEKYLPWIENNYIFTSEKHLITGDVFIDDKPDNLETSICERKITIDYPYNRNVKVDLRAYDHLHPVRAWATIYLYIKNLSHIVLN
jgi:5'(3')-deoxyribonucleotidase